MRDNSWSNSRDDRDNGLGDNRGRVGDNGGGVGNNRGRVGNNGGGVGNNRDRVGDNGDRVRHVNGGGSDVDWCWGDMYRGWGHVDRWLRDVDAVDLSTSSTFSSTTATVSIATSISSSSTTVSLWHLDKGWRGFHCEALLGGNFPAGCGGNVIAGCFLFACTDRPVCVEADVLVLPSAISVGQRAEVAATSPGARNIEADILPWCRLALSLVHGEALLGRLLLAAVHHPVLALLLGDHLGHADALLLWSQRALLAGERFALVRR